MTDTSTLVISQYVEDRKLAVATLGRNIDGIYTHWFASILPVLRSHPMGAEVATLREAAGLDSKIEHFGFRRFLGQLIDADVVCVLHRRDYYLVLGSLRLTASFWLKDTARRQSQPYTYVSPA